MTIRTDAPPTSRFSTQDTTRQSGELAPKTTTSEPAAARAIPGEAPLFTPAHAALIGSARTIDVTVKGAATPIDPKLKAELDANRLSGGARKASSTTTPVKAVQGDTLGGIAASHGVSTQAVVDANPHLRRPGNQLGEFNLIYPGDVVNVPKGEATATKAAATTAAAATIAATPTTPTAPTATTPAKPKELTVADNVAGFATGVKEGAVSLATGVGSMAVGAVKLTGLAGKDAAKETWSHLGATVKNIATDPMSLVHGLIDPVTTAWKEGRHGEAIGRGTFEAVGFVFGAKGLTGAAKAAKGARVAEAGVAVTDAASTTGAGAAKVAAKSVSDTTATAAARSTPKGASSLDDFKRANEAARNRTNLQSTTFTQPAEVQDAIGRAVALKEQGHFSAPMKLTGKALDDARGEIAWRAEKGGLSPERAMQSYFGPLRLEQGTVEALLNPRSAAAAPGATTTAAAATKAAATPRATTAASSGLTDFKRANEAARNRANLQQATLTKPAEMQDAIRRAVALKDEGFFSAPMKLSGEALQSARHEITMRSQHLGMSKQAAMENYFGPLRLEQSSIDALLGAGRRAQATAAHAGA